MKKYITPQMDIMKFDAESIVAASTSNLNKLVNDSSYIEEASYSSIFEITE